MTHAGIECRLKKGRGSIFGGQVNEKKIAKGVGGKWLE